MFVTPVLFLNCSESIQNQQKHIDTIFSLF